MTKLSSTSGLRLDFELFPNERRDQENISGASCHLLGRIDVKDDCSWLMSELAPDVLACC